MSPSYSHQRTHIPSVAEPPHPPSPHRTPPLQPLWHSRGYLPHWEAGEVAQHVIFRLHDSLPQRILQPVVEALRRIQTADAEAQLRKSTLELLRRGCGVCHLRNPKIAELVQNALLHFDSVRYRLHAWVVMPNHAHVLVTPMRQFSLSAILHTWKSFTAKQANRILRRTGPFWFPESFDRAIRNDLHFVAAVAYIDKNPVVAGLCSSAGDWPFSSAGWEGRGDRG